MTVGNAIEQASHFRPHQYTDATLAGWLSELDGKIYRDLMSTHEDCPEEAPGVYDKTTDADTDLLAKFPDDRLYVMYLCAMIDWHNAEYERYNNELIAFNTAYENYSSAYNREHLPLHENRLSFWGVDDADSELPDPLV